MKKTFVIFSLLVSLQCLYSQDKFDIVFIAPHWGINHDWLNKIQNEWGATEICMYVQWMYLEEKPGEYNFWSADHFIDSIINYHSLKVSIRVTMGYNMPEWVKYSNKTVFSKHDYHITKSGSVFSQYGISPLNFTSEKSRNYMLSYYKAVVEHLASKYPGRITEIVPSITPDSETEFPYLDMCGYSNPEVTRFRLYLNQKYNSINSLNQRWGSDFAAWKDIQPKNYNWDIIRTTTAPVNYDCPAGRIDWINFRTTLLKEFIDELAAITHNAGFSMGVQIGCLYDGSIEKRGWIDPTTLFENVDAIHHDDIVEYKPNFNFSADLLRSICSFWTGAGPRKHIFSTEVTWHNWPKSHPKELSNVGYPPAMLDSEYTRQVTTFYDKGASEIYMAQWDMPLDILDIVAARFPQLKAKLQAISGTFVQTPVYTSAVHLSFEQAAFEGVYGTKNSSDQYHITFGLLQSIQPQPGYLIDIYNGHSDIVTNYMISRNPGYINRYSDFYLTKSSKYMPEEVYNNLSTGQFTPRIINGTQVTINGEQLPKYIEGEKNEYNEDRTPVRISR